MMSLPRFIHCSLAAVSLLLALAPLQAQSLTDSAVFVFTRGHDTTHVEWMLRRGAEVQVLSVVRGPAPNVLRYDIRLGPDLALEHMHVFNAEGPHPGARLTPRARIYMKGDSTIEERLLGSPPRLATPGRTQLYNSDATGGLVFTLLPILASRAPAAHDSVVGQHVAGTLGARPLIIRREGADVVRIGSARTGALRVRLGPDGHAREIDTMGSSSNLFAQRTTWLDADSVRRAFAAAEQARPTAPLSPDDSVVAALGGGRVTVHYGRPSRRGREIFGGIVPWNRVWRTGANMATHLSSDRPLRLGDAELPAGRYTLWTIPAPDGWTLIVSRQTDIWGTDYDPQHDALRVPMQLQRGGDPVEQFTIAIDATGNRGVLRLRWDTLEANVPLQVR